MSVSVYGVNPSTGAFTKAEVNFSNANMRMIMAHLGYDLEPPCEIPVARLLKRCPDVLVDDAGELDDGGFPDAITRTPGGVTMIDCGLRPGYLRDAVDRILTVCFQTVRLGADYVTFA